MCIGPLAPKAPKTVQAAAPPPIPQAIVPPEPASGVSQRLQKRRQSALASGQRGTLLTGVLAPASTTTTSLLGT